MEQEILKTNLLAIAVAGFLMAVSGIILYIFRGALSDSVRYLMPIPPIGVASYIFVFNMYQYYSGRLPEGSWNTVKEILISTAITAGFFAVFTFLLILIISLVKR